MKIIKVQLAATSKQRGLLNKQLDEHRFLYNHCLYLKIKAYKEKKKNLSCFDLIKNEIKNLKLNGKFVVSNYSSLQQTVRRLDKSYQAFFRRIKSGKMPGFPRFKNSGRFRTINYSIRGNGNKIKQNHLYLQNIGLIKCLWFSGLPNYKTLSVTKKGDNFYANFIVENPPELPCVTNKEVGLDFGLKTFLVTSDNERIDSPKFHKKSLKEIAKLHRRIHRSEKRSRLRRKHKKTLVKAYNKVANRRKDFNHKLSRRLVNSYDKIFIEDIKISELLSNIKNINQTYMDVAFGQFKTFLTYKAENAGKILKTINPAYTTQECSCCGNINELELKTRVYMCLCGYKEDRDINAAQNILRRGLASLEAP